MAEDKIEDQLTDRQIRFCQEYSIDLNATRAYKSVYDVDDESAAASSSRLLTNVKVKDYISKLQEDAANSLQITKERILIEFARIAFSDIRKFYDENNNLKNIQEIDDFAAAALAGIETDEIFDWVDGDKVHTGYTKKIKTYNKVNALENLARILGHNPATKTELSGELTLKQITGMQVL